MLYPFGHTKSAVADAKREKMFLCKVIAAFFLSRLVTEFVNSFDSKTQSETDSINVRESEI